MGYTYKCCDTLKWRLRGNLVVITGVWRRQVALNLGNAGMSGYRDNRR